MDREGNVIAGCVDSAQLTAAPDMAAAARSMLDDEITPGGQDDEAMGSRADVEAGSVWQLVRSADGTVTSLALHKSGTTVDGLSRFVLLLSEPAQVMARALTIDEDIDPEQLLGDWLKSAGQLRQWIHVHRASTTVMFASELRDLDPAAAPPHPDWSSQLMEQVVHLTTADPGALLLSACAALFDSDPGAVVVFEELYAACDVLGAGKPGAPDRRARSERLSLETSDVMHEWQRLRRVERKLGEDLDQQHEQIRALKKALDQDRQDLLALQAQNQGLTDELEQQAKVVAQHAADAKQALSVSRQREVVQSTELAAGQARQAEVLKQLADSRAAAQTLELEVQRTRTDAARARAQAVQTWDEAKALASADQAAQLCRSQTEVSQLLLRLHQTQQKLEEFCLSQHERERAQAGSDSGRIGHGEYRDVLGGSVGDAERHPWQNAQPQQQPCPDSAAPYDTWSVIDVVGPVDDGLHRHLEVLVQSAVEPDVSSNLVRLRLIDHEGRYGLAVLLATRQPLPMGAWVPQGQEQGWDFMLFIPEDKRSAQSLQQLPSSDWLLINRWVDTLQTYLATQRRADLKYWHGAASKVQLLLQQLPARLRYDDLQVAVAAGSPAGYSLSVVLRDVIFGHKPHCSLAFEWTPGAGYLRDGGPTALALVRVEEPSQHLPPVAAWPLDAHGGWMQRWSLPVGRDVGWRAARDLWIGLSAPDREFALALLDALPAVALKLDSLPLSKAQQDEVLAEARWLFKQASGAVRAIAWRHGLLRLMRR